MPADIEIRKLGLAAPPLGIAYIASVIEGAGNSVTIVDMGALGTTYKELGEELARLHPDVVGVTSTTPTIYEAVKCVTVSKQACPEAVTVMGGCHITFCPAETMRLCPDLDIGVIGEGEATVVDLLDALSGKKSLAQVDGITYRDNGQIVRTKPRRLIENLDDVPFPARHLLPFDRYTLLNRKFPMGGMITSRGCPFGCTFCSSSRVYGKRFRGRSPSNVVDEMELLVERYRARSIEILDDTFTIDKNRARGIAEEIIRRGLDVSWVFGSRVDTIAPDLLHLFKKAGCYMVYYGIESGTDRILKELNKGITLEQVRKAILWAKRAGIETIASFIIGTPGETRAEAMQTIEFARKCGVDYAQFTVMTPYPGTEIYESAKREGHLITEDWSKFTTLKPVLCTKELSAEEQESLVALAYKRFYLRAPFIIRNIIKGRFRWLGTVAKTYLESLI